MFCGLPVMVGDGRGRTDVRRHRDGEQVGHRVAPQRERQFEDERREHETNRVVDEERGEHAGDRRYSREQRERVARPPHHPAAHLREEAGEAEIGHHDHHAEQQGERVEVDRLVGVLQW